MTRMAVLVLSGVCVIGLAAAAPAGLPSSSGIIALNSLPNPSTTLATANVTDAKGTMVGAVQKIVLDASGSVEEVSARIRETVADKLGI